MSIEAALALFEKGARAEAFARLKKIIIKEAGLALFDPKITLATGGNHSAIRMRLAINCTEIIDTVHADSAGICTLIKTAIKTKEIIMQQSNVTTAQSILDLLNKHSSSEQEIIVQEIIRKNEALQDHIENEKEASYSDGYAVGYDEAQ